MPVPPKIPFSAEEPAASQKLIHTGHPFHEHIPSQPPGLGHDAPPATVTDSGNDPLVRRLVDEWIDISRNDKTDAFRHDLAALRERDSHGQRPFRYYDDMIALNKSLAAKNLLPNMTILGNVDGQVLLGENSNSKHLGVLATSGHFNEIEDADFDARHSKVVVQPTEVPRNLGQVSPDGVKQGCVNDCRFEAWLSSFSAANPGAVQRMIKDNGNGTFTVTFQGDKNHPQTVSAPTTWERDTFSPGASEWDAIIGKAYRQRENTPFGPGTGISKDVEGLFTGKSHTMLIQQQDCSTGDKIEDTIRSWFGESPVCHQDTGSEPLRQLVNNSNRSILEVESSELGRRIQEALDQHMLLTTSFRPDSDRCAVARDTSGKAVQIITGHEYSVLGYNPKTQTVTLRNPWGYNPHIGDGARVGSGIEHMSLAEFQRIAMIINVEETF